MQGRSQLRKASLHPGSQSHSTDNSSAVIQPHPSQSVTSPVLHNIQFSSFHKNTTSFTPFQNEVTADSFEDENIANSERFEDQFSPVEIPEIRSPQTLPSLRRAAHIRSFPPRHTIVCRNHCLVLIDVFSLIKHHSVF